MVGKAVGVELLADGEVFRGLFLVLVQYPVKARAVLKAVVPSLLRDARQVGSESSMIVPLSGSDLRMTLGETPDMRAMVTGLSGESRAKVFIPAVQVNLAPAPRPPHR